MPEHTQAKCLSLIGCMRVRLGRILIRSVHRFVAHRVLCMRVCVRVMKRNQEMTAYNRRVRALNMQPKSQAHQIFHEDTTNERECVCVCCLLSIRPSENKLNVMDGDGD